MAQTDEKIAQRREYMGLLAKCPATDLNALWQGFGHAEPHSFLRHPEVGSVMVQGRTGAVGSAFNLGEVTVTRCTVRLTTGEDGHGYVQGRDKAKATQAALIDALMQSDKADDVQRAILTPLDQAMTKRNAHRREKAAATKVDFFTMVRGED